MIKIITPERNNDTYGAGFYGASRGNRKHNGTDFACYPDSQVLSLCDGIVTKLGYPYSTHMNFRYVQVTDKRGFDLRYFYVKPKVSLGDKICKDDMIGIVQDLQLLYPGITDHVHLEIKNKQGNFIDPATYEVE